MEMAILSFFDKVIGPKIIMHAPVDNGEIVGILSVGNDISHLKELEEK